MMVSAEDERMQQQPLEANAEEEFEALVGGDAAMTERDIKIEKQQHAAPSNGQPAAAAAAAAAAASAVGGAHRNGAGSQQHPHPQHSQSHHQPRFHPTALQGAGAKPAAAHAASQHPSHGPPAALSTRSVSAAASPSASASPHASSLTLPFPHVQATFFSSACYLHSNASPSQRDGLTANDEFMLRAHTCGFMSAMGQRLKLGQLALATASVYLQVFYTHYSFKAMDRMELACACLFLAGKVEERRIRVDQVVSAYFVEKEAEEKRWAIASGQSFVPRPRPVLDSHDWEALRQRIYEHESILLDAVEYNFDVVHPYTFLRLFLQKYIYSNVYCKEDDKFISRHLHDTGGLTQIAWNFINDSLRTPLALLYSPSVICVAAIRMAMKHLISGGVLAEEPTRKSSIVGPGKVKPWHEELFGVDKKTLTFIQSQITRSLELSPPVGQKSPALDLRMLEVHRKVAQGRSMVPLPVARSTHEIFKQINAQQKQQAQQNQNRGNAPAAGAAAAAAAASAACAPAAAPPSSHPDRKRPRSPPIKVEGEVSKRDVVVIDDDHKRRPARSPSRASVPWITDPSYAPLDRPPSPFLDSAATHYRTRWLPDLRPGLPVHTHTRDPHHREHRSPHKQHRRDDKDRGNRHDKDSKRATEQAAAAARSHHADTGSTKSPHGRRSQRRSNSRDRVNVQRAASEAASAAAASSSSAAVAPSSSPLEEGELRAAPLAPLTSIVEESESSKTDVAMAVDDESRMHLSPRAQLARSSTSLTKSCSSLTLSSLSVSASGPGRLHLSASMSNLQSHAVGPTAAASDILSGDILRMSSSHLPADPALAMSMGGGVTTVNEEDIMREINRGAKELGAVAAEEDDDREGAAEGDAEHGRKSKRARIGSRPSSPVPASNEFEGTKMDTAAASVASPTRTIEAPVVSSSAAAPVFPASSESSSSAALTTATSSALATTTALFSRQAIVAAPLDADASMAEADERKRMEDDDESKSVEMKSAEEAEKRMHAHSTRTQPTSAKSSPLHAQSESESVPVPVSAAPLPASAAPTVDVVPSKAIVADLVLVNGHALVQPEDEQKSATAMEIAH